MAQQQRFDLRAQGNGGGSSGACDCDGRGGGGKLHGFGKRATLGKRCHKIAGEGIARSGGIHGLNGENAALDALLSARFSFLRVALPSLSPVRSVIFLVWP